MEVACLRPALCYRLRGNEGRGREARPAVGHLWGEWSHGATGYRTNSKEVACCETRLVNPIGGVRTPKAAWAAWMLDRAGALIEVKSTSL